MNPSIQQLIDEQINNQKLMTQYIENIDEIMLKVDESYAISSSDCNKTRPVPDEKNNPMLFKNQQQIDNEKQGKKMPE